MTSGGAFALLQRIAAARVEKPDYERCEMCGERIADEHGHVVNLDSRNLMCTCRPCTLLFAYDTARLHYRAVPDRYLRFDPLPAALWDDLQIPVGLVFVFRNSALDRTVAFYPGPAGATESELPLGAWDEVVATNPVLAVARPDVEALLLRAPDNTAPDSTAPDNTAPDNTAPDNTAPDSRRAGIECFLVPIDRCYELVGRLRQGWRGFDGGQQARSELAEFFADVARRARPATR